MSPRSIRRAAERKAAKLARKAARRSESDLSVPAEPSRDCKGAVSVAQLAANRANAQLSSGPKTVIGKAISSRNHFKHGFRGEFCVLPSENQEDFDELLAAFREEHQPSTPSEDALVDQLAKHLWLSRRAGGLLDEALTGIDDLGERQKSVALYLRYQTANDRGFSKCLNDLLRIRAQKFRERLDEVALYKRAEDVKDEVRTAKAQRGDGCRAAEAKTGRGTAQAGGP